MTTTTKKTRPPKKAAVNKTAKAVIQIRLDAKTKDRAEKFFKRHGMTTGDGVRMFIDQVIDTGAFPFEPVSARTPNPETEKAMRDVLEGRTERVSLDELKKRLLGDG